jgi:uncharacterized protein (AIM24 family)
MQGFVRARDFTGNGLAFLHLYGTLNQVSSSDEVVQTLCLDINK